MNKKRKTKSFFTWSISSELSISPHTSANLIIEVHAKKPIPFSYDAVNIEGMLELVPKDDEYNVFFRLREAKIKKIN